MQPTARLLVGATQARTVLGSAVGGGPAGRAVGRPVGGAATAVPAVLTASAAATPATAASHGRRKEVTVCMVLPGFVDRSCWLRRSVRAGSVQRGLHTAAGTGSLSGTRYELYLSGQLARRYVTMTGRRQFGAG